MLPNSKPIRIAIIAVNGLEDIEFIIPIDIWKRANFIVDIVVCEIKNSFILNYSSLKVSAQLNIKHTNLIQYDALYFAGGPGYKNYLSPSSVTKNDGESKLHVEIKKFYQDKDKLIIAMCAAPIAIWCILDNLIKDKNFKFTAFKDPELIKGFESQYLDKRVVVDNNFITAQAAGCSFDLAFTVIEKLTSFEYAKEIANKIKYSYEKYQD